MDIVADVLCGHAVDQQNSSESCPCKTLPMHYSVWAAAQLQPEVTGLHQLMQMARSDPSRLSRLDDYGYSALHYAAQRNHARKLRLLLDHISDPDFGTCGATALHRAAFAGSFECCKLLLERGADANRKDTSASWDLTPIQKARQNSHEEIVKLLLSFGADDLPLPAELNPSRIAASTSTNASAGSSDSGSVNNQTTVSDSRVSKAEGEDVDTFSPPPSTASTTTSISTSTSAVTASIRGQTCENCGQETFALYKRRKGRGIVCGKCR